MRRGECRVSVNQFTSAIMEKNFYNNFASDLIGQSLAQIADQTRESRARQIRNLLAHKRLPVDGWDDISVLFLLQELAMMDSNNHMHRIGVGEREGRIFSHLVAQRHYGLIHGIGRSGDLTAAQPKAPGSSLLYKLTQRLALHAVQICGVQATTVCIPVPVATGMALALCFSALRNWRPSSARFVIVSRMDQGSCRKSVHYAGFESILVHMHRNGDALQTDLRGIEETIDRVGVENILCVMSTTSSFAPREPDQVDAIAKICARKDVPHIVNNAYGLQCTRCCHLIDQGLRVGRVDAYVQSTDKNFLCPVGGALICGNNETLIQDISKIYPGRACGSAILDLFITLLQMGQTGLKRLLEERKNLHRWFYKKLVNVCSDLGLRVLMVPANRISIAVDLSSLQSNQQEHAQEPQQQLQECVPQRQWVPVQGKQHVEQHNYPLMRSQAGKEPQLREMQLSHQEQSQQAQQQQRQLRGESQVDEQKRKQQTSLVVEEKMKHLMLVSFLGSFIFRRGCTGLRVVRCFVPPKPMQRQGRISARALSADDIPAAVGDDGGTHRSNVVEAFLKKLQHAAGMEHVPSFTAKGVSLLEEILERQTSRNTRAADSVDCKEPTPTISVLPKLQPYQGIYNGHILTNWGSHCENYPVPYCTVAVAIGAKSTELLAFFYLFEKAVKKVRQMSRTQIPTRCAIEMKVSSI